MLPCFAIQSFKSVLQLMKEAFFKHGEKEALRSCVRAINFCSTESQGELQDFARNELKELEDELIAKLKAAIKEVVVCFNYNLYFSLIVGHMDIM
jgi:cohesin complex subunit SA-1/2